MSVSRFLNSVRSSFNAHPLVGSSVVYGTFCVAAEYTQQATRQKYSADRPPIDYAAVPRFAFVGTFIYSPMLYFWYSKILDRRLVGTLPKTIAKKVLLDQFIATPVLIFAFYTTMSMLEGKEDVFQELRNKFVKTFQMNCLFWMPAQTINFLLVPPMYRIVYMAVVSFGWINILSWVKRQQGSDVMISEVAVRK